MPYAVNLADITGRERQVMAGALIAPITPHRILLDNVESKGYIADVGLLMECDEDRAGAIVQVIRLKYKNYELRCYYSKTGNGGWHRV